MRYFFVLYLSVILLTSSTPTNTEKIPHQDLMNMNEAVTKKVEKLDTTDLKVIQEMTFRQQIPRLLHNNGNPILTQPMDENSNQKLIAIYLYEKNGINFQHNYYDSYAGSANFLQELSKQIANDVKKSNVQFFSINNSSANMLAVSNSPKAVRTHTLTFRDSLSEISSIFSSQLVFTREGSAVNINGELGSVWNVHTFQTNEQKKGFLVEQVSRLSVDQSAQMLLSYGPVSHGEQDTISVGLSGYVPAASWTFNIGKYTVTDSSSPASKYARWIFERPTLMYWGLTTFSTEPGIRVSNTSGDLVVDSSHTIRDNYSGTHYTGSMRDVIPDR